MAQTNAEINILFHLNEFVPFITAISDRLFKGLISNIKVPRAIKKGKSIRRNPAFWLIPSTLKSLGFRASLEATCGSVDDRAATPIKRGIAPIVLEAAKTARIIKRYLQKLFFPEKDDSRWFMLL